MNKKILIVSDDKDVLNIIASLFRDRGYSVEHATSSMEGIVYLNKIKFDFVLVELLMSNGNGTQVLNVVNTMEIKPLFYFLTTTNKENLLDFLKSGVKNIFQKQFGFYSFLAELDKEFFN